MSFRIKNFPENTIIFYLPNKCNGILLVMNRLFLLRKYGDHKRKGFVGYKNHVPVYILLLRYFIYRLSASNLQTKNPCIQWKQIHVARQIKEMGGRVFRWLYVMECVVGSFVHKCLFYFTGRTRQKNNNILVCVNWYIGSLRSNIYLYLNPFAMEFPFIVFVNFLFKNIILFPVTSIW